MEAYFKTYEVKAKVAIGLKERDKWQEPWVVIIPGTFDGTLPARPMDGGTFGPPEKKKSWNPRELAEWTRTITFSIFAVDKDNKQSEEHQIEALEQLIEWTLRASWNAVDPVTGINVGGPSLEWGKSILLHPPVQMAYGRELLLQATYKHPFFDVPQLVLQPPPGLQKQLTDTAQSGRAAYVALVGPNGASISNLAFCNRGQVGQYITLSGAASSRNNGTFPVVGLNSAQSVVIDNPLAVAPDLNNGAISWEITPEPPV
jgi:hypothetical protein